MEDLLPWWHQAQCRLIHRETGFQRINIVVPTTDRALQRLPFRLPDDGVRRQYQLPRRERAFCRYAAATQSARRDYHNSCTVSAAYRGR